MRLRILGNISKATKELRNHKIRFRKNSLNIFKPFYKKNTCSVWIDDKYHGKIKQWMVENNSSLLEYADY